MHDYKVFLPTEIDTDINFIPIQSSLASNIKSKESINCRTRKMTKRDEEKIKEKHQSILGKKQNEEM